jgi:hypothetical protein
MFHGGEGIREELCVKLGKFPAQHFDLENCVADTLDVKMTRLADWLVVLEQVTYFKKRRVMEYQRNKTLERLKAEGAQEMPGQIGPPAPGQRP